jgi:hypothetical protein
VVLPDSTRLDSGFYGVDHAGAIPVYQSGESPCVVV